MAKKGGKGIGKYFLILFFMIVAAFFITVTVMMFQPFTEILGITYFTYKDESKIVQTTDEDKTVIDFSTIKEIKINSGFADVVVERSTDVTRDTVYIENHATGFAKGALSEKVYSKSVILTGADKDVLEIKVTEPEGFLHFNKNIKIKIMLPVTEGAYGLGNTKITVENTSGDLLIGNNVQPGVPEGGASSLDVNDISFTTKTGELYLYPNNGASFESLFLKADNSSIISYEGLSFSDSFELHVKDGNYDFKRLQCGIKQKTGGTLLKPEYTFYPIDIKLDLGNANFSADYLGADVTFTIDGGYVDVKNFEGSFVANDVINQMTEATFTFGTVDGVISLPYGNSGKLIIKEVLKGSQVFAVFEDGYVDIDKHNGYAWIETNSGLIDIENISSNVNLKTQSGNIKVSFAQDYTSSEATTIVSSTGSIKLAAEQDFAFMLNISGNGAEAQIPEYSIEGIAEQVKFPFAVNQGTTKINLTTNGKVEVTFFEQPEETEELK